MWKDYYLKQNTVLDDRYMIDGILGEGGFGITYSANHLLSGRRVAVKEYFCGEYMTRSGETGLEASAVSPDDLPRFRTEKERFVKEARVLRDFSDLAGIVRVEDYFEANGTAYIVMELLEGVTLRKYIKENGRMEAEQVFRRLVPLIEALGRIHAAGIVHRDFSPDNIMVSPGGALTLMDFGAARSFYTKTVSHSLIYKDGFAPQEQIDRRGRLGPHTDLYSVCATAYYCVTGKVPDDAIQRMLYDELKSPSQLGVAISSEAETLIMRGLSLRQDRRWQSAGELLSEIRKIWPDPDPERTARLKRRRFLTIAAAAVLLLVGACLSYRYYRAHEVEIRFRNTETRTFWLFPREGTEEKVWRETLPLVKERVKVLAGSEYLWRESGQKVELVLPLELFRDSDPDDIVRIYIAGAGNLELHETGSDQTYIPLSRDDITDIRVTEEDGTSYIEFALSERAASLGDASAESDESILTSLDQKDHPFFLAWDMQENRFGSFTYFNVSAEGDGKTLRAEKKLDGSLCDLFLYVLNEEPLPASLKCIPDWNILWEKTENNLNAGASQVGADQLTGETVLVRFDTFASGKVERAAGSMLLKSRLDAVEKPYAFGVRENAPDDYILKIRPDDFLDAELEAAGSSGSLTVTDVWGRDAGIWINPQEISYQGIDLAASAFHTVDHEDGTWEIRLDFPSDLRLEQTRLFLENLQTEGDGYIYLTCSGTHLARGRAPDALKSLEDRYIAFTELTIPGYEKMDEQSRSFGSFLEQFEMSLIFIIVSKSDLIALDENGVPTGEEVQLKGCSYSDLEEEANAMIREGTANGTRGAGGGYDAFFNPSSGQMTVYFSELGDGDLLSDGFRLIRAFAEKHRLADGRYPKILFYLFPDNIRWKKYAAIYYEWSGDAGGMVWQADENQQNGFSEEEIAKIKAFCESGGNASP